MKNIMVVLSLLFLLNLKGFSQAQVLSEGAKISVLTMGPTQEELYSAFGHSAFRVYDSLQHIDAFFNYGVFNFNQPHFYLNFAKVFECNRIAVPRMRYLEQRHKSHGS